LTFKLLYCFVVLAHDRRRILHVNVTSHPTDHWTAQQIVEAFPGDREQPKYLHRDQDSIYGKAFSRKIAALGLREVVSAPKSPWQNPFVERVIGSLCRECTDHVIPLGEKHLLRVLQEYVAYYNTSRTHLSLHRNAPTLRHLDNGPGDVVASPVVAGLHHRYSRAAT
jgi:transposase InsO family protein